MSTTQKRDGKEFCGEVFSQGWKNYQTRFIKVMVNTLSLGCPMAPH
jgi:hypothetical protein